MTATRTVAAALAALLALTGCGDDTDTQRADTLATVITSPTSSSSDGDPDLFRALLDDDAPASVLALTDLDIDRLGAAYCTTAEAAEDPIEWTQALIDSRPAGWTTAQTADVALSALFAYCPAEADRLGIGD